MTGVIQRERKRRRSQPISRRVLDTVAAKPDAWKLSLYEDEITPNFCLRELMKRDFRLELPEVDPLAFAGRRASPRKIRVGGSRRRAPRIGLGSFE